MKNILAFFLSLVPLFTLSGENYLFSSLSVENGLSQITVVCIYQDKHGFMWFGTRNGLNKFDGYNFEIYKNHSYDQDSLSISSNHITCIAEDKHNNLWVGTRYGLNKFDRGKNNFKQYLSDKAVPNTLSHNTIQTLFTDSQGSFWVGTNNGLNFYDPENDCFHLVNLPGLRKNFINMIAEKNKCLYIATDNGIVVYDIEQRKILNIYKHNPSDRNSLTNNVLKAIFIDRNNNVWAGGEEGLHYQKNGTDNFIFYDTNKGLSNNYVRSIAESPDGTILIGTANGLNVFNKNSNAISQYRSDSLKKGALNHYSIFDIYFDSTNTLWIGTYAGGVSYYSPYGYLFEFYSPASKMEETLGILGSCIEYNGKLYIATEGGGLLEFDMKNRSFRNYILTNKQDKLYTKNIIKSICLDGSDVLCGTNDGIVYRFNTTNKTFTSLYKCPRRKPIYHISKSRRNDLIIGSITPEQGLIILSEGKEPQTRFPVTGEEDFGFSGITCVLEIEPDVFLIGTRNDGLYRYDYANHTLVNYQNKKNNNNTLEYKIPDNSITCIFKDSNEGIWVGTQNKGLCKFDPKSEKFTIYNNSNGLLSNSICSIVEDNNKNLWISSSNGITLFKTQEQKFTNYSYGSGIQVQEFSPAAGIVTSDNKIIFLGNNGFISFSPNKLRHNPNIPPITLTKLFINNNLILPGGEDKILSSQLSEQKEIVLKYNQSNISIEYCALNYIYSNKNQYMYMLEGFDKEWNYAGNRRIAYYTNIPPGKYKLIVKGSNNDGVWNNVGTELSIVIHPPFWQTWWAYCIYAAIISLVLLFILRYFSEKRQYDNQLKIKQIEVRAQKELHEERNRLFTNFSHELRTPLTLIISPLDDISKKSNLDEDTQSKVTLMKSNAHRLLRIVNNLMDFQKQESGTLKLRLGEYNIVKFIKEMTLAFHDLAISRNIHLKFNHLTDNLKLWFDKNLLEKVFFNFLSNAFKNTFDGGNITINMSVYDLSELNDHIPPKLNNFTDSSVKYLYVEIKDDGVGMEESELEKVFRPFYQVAQNEHSKSGTGLGLSLSKAIIEMHRGTVWAASMNKEGAVFAFVLPVTDKYYGENDFIKTTGYESFVYPEVEVLAENEVVKSDDEKRHTVLVVEDNKDLRNYIMSHLSGKYNIIETVDGEDAINKATEFLPSLIITDLMMPKMNGLEMCRILKKDVLTSHIPIIMITARSMSEDIKEGYKMGADDYITKPFDASVLIMRVENIIQNREKLKEIYSKKFSLQSLGVEITSVDERFMQRLYEILKQNISNTELNLDSFCSELGISKSNLYRKLKSLTGLSPNEFIRNFRLETATKILKETNMSISEIYMAVGFNSIAYFSSCFKTFYGMSPTEYRNSI